MNIYIIYSAHRLHKIETLILTHSNCTSGTSLMNCHSFSTTHVMVIMKSWITHNINPITPGQEIVCTGDVFLTLVDFFNYCEFLEVYWSSSSTITHYHTIVLFFVFCFDLNRNMSKNADRWLFWHFDRAQLVFPLVFMLSWAKWLLVVAFCSTDMKEVWIFFCSTNFHSETTNVNFLMITFFSSVITNIFPFFTWLLLLLPVAELTKWIWIYCIMKLNGGFCLVLNGTSTCQNINGYIQLIF